MQPPACVPATPGPPLATMPGPASTAPPGPATTLTHPGTGASLAHPGSAAPLHGGIERAAPRGRHIPRLDHASARRRPICTAPAVPHRLGTMPVPDGPTCPHRPGTGPIPDVPAGLLRPGATPIPDSPTCLHRPGAMPIPDAPACPRTTPVPDSGSTETSQPAAHLAIDDPASPPARGAGPGTTGHITRATHTGTGDTEAQARRFVPGDRDRTRAGHSARIASNGAGNGASESHPFAPRGRDRTGAGQTARATRTGAGNNAAEARPIAPRDPDGTGGDPIARAMRTGTGNRAAEARPFTPGDGDRAGAGHAARATRTGNRGSAAEARLFAPNDRDRARGSDGPDLDPARAMRFDRAGPVTGAAVTCEAPDPRPGQRLALPMAPFDEPKRLALGSPAPAILPLEASRGTTGRSGAEAGAVQTVAMKALSPIPGGRQALPTEPSNGLGGIAPACTAPAIGPLEASRGAAGRTGTRAGAVRTVARRAIAPAPGQRRALPADAPDGLGRIAPGSTAPAILSIKASRGSAGHTGTGAGAVRTVARPAPATVPGRPQALPTGPSGGHGRLAPGSAAPATGLLGSGRGGIVDGAAEAEETAEMQAPLSALRRAALRRGPMPALPAHGAAAGGCVRPAAARAGGGRG
ncbi:hypothetical protein LNKW23_14650 [Paralimibaculum aggregatum]|uniref:Uncharacterized protein n=1 Tax=Paralimibaculum aggregatum TaxID=3036245 RepID=A0ABQ6LKR1_9RHOB|nr:hypothetical protein LNKW23_14650 [Limibaculum sp. NKW23]